MSETEIVPPCRVALAKALSDQNRVRALLALQNRELCVCQIIELLGFAPSTVSKHMTTLKQAQLVEGRKEGRWMYYRLAGKKAPQVSRDAILWTCKHLAQTREIQDDARQLKKILRHDPEKLCRRYVKS